MNDDLLLDFLRQGSKAAWRVQVWIAAALLVLACVIVGVCE